MDANWLKQSFPYLNDIQPLAPSGQKEVFSATHDTEGAVVLKIFKPGSNPERIKREMDAPRKVKSHRVPVVADLGTLASNIGEIVWLRERRIEGRSLREVLNQETTIALDRVIHIGKNVLEVLVASENANVVHRDIKPGNIIIDPFGDAWVIDFGLARHLDLESVTASNDKLAPCTPGYAPVEQFTNQKKEVDGRADLFALGVTLYECIEGVNPYVQNAKGWREVFERVKTMSFPRLSGAVVPEALKDVVEAMTRTKAEHRPHDALETLKWFNEI